MPISSALMAFAIAQAAIADSPDHWRGFSVFAQEVLGPPGLYGVLAEIEFLWHFHVLIVSANHAKKPLGRLRASGT